MNNKMAISAYQQLNPKNRLSKPQKESHRYGDHLEGYQLGVGRRMGER